MPAPVVVSAGGNAFSPSFSLIKDGYLHVKVRNRLRSSWRKVWCVVRKHNGAGLGAVLFSQYKTPVDASEDLGCCARIDLCTATAIRPCPESKKKHAFMVECTRAARLGARHMSLQSKTFHFHSSSSAEKDSWMDLLLKYAPSASLGASSTMSKCRTGSLPDLAQLDGATRTRDSVSSLDFNGMYEPSAARFMVDFEGSSQVPFRGECTLIISAEAIILTNDSSRQSVEYPLRSLGNYGFQEGRFFFHSKRPSSPVPAKLSFKTEIEVAEEIQTRIQFVSKMMTDKESKECEQKMFGSWAPDSSVSRNLPFLSAPGAQPVLLRSASDNALLSDRAARISLTEDDPTTPYSVTRIRNSWLPLKSPSPDQNSGGDGEDDGDNDDGNDIGDLVSFSTDTRYSAVKIRSKSDTCGPTSLQSNVNQYETMLPQGKGFSPVLNRSPPNRKRPSSPGPRYAKPIPPNLRSAPTSQTALTPLDLSPEYSSVALESSLEASAQAALRRRYSPIFLASHGSSPVSSRGSPMTSSKESSMFTGSPCSQSPLVSSGPSAAGSPQVSSCSPISELSVELASRTKNIGGRTGGVSPAIDQCSYAVSDPYRVRSASEPVTYAGYDHLDHSSSRVIDGYSRLAHQPPDRPVKPMPDDDNKGYSKLDSSPVTGYDHLSDVTCATPKAGYDLLSDALCSAPKGLSRRPAKRVTPDADAHRIRASSESGVKNTRINCRVAVRKPRAVNVT